MSIQLGTDRYDDGREILERFRAFAVVGLSADPARTSNEIASFLLTAGYRVIPINPSESEILGQPCYPSLAEVPSEEGIEVVDIFRRSSLAGIHVDEAIAIEAKAVWLQVGVIDAAAAARARAAGLLVAMDLCPKIEYRRHFGFKRPRT